MRTREGMAVTKAKGRLPGKQPKLKPSPGEPPRWPLPRRQTHHRRTRRTVLRRQIHRLPRSSTSGQPHAVTSLRANVVTTSRRSTLRCRRGQTVVPYPRKRNGSYGSRARPLPPSRRRPIAQTRSVNTPRRRTSHGLRRSQPRQSDGQSPFAGRPASVGGCSAGRARPSREKLCGFACLSRQRELLPLWRVGRMPAYFKRRSH